MAIPYLDVEKGASLAAIDTIAKASRLQFMSEDETRILPRQGSTGKRDRQRPT